MPMMDYSSQALSERKGKHTGDLMNDLNELDFGIMLEIKNKEASALRAVVQLRGHGLSPAAPNLPRLPLTLPGITKAKSANSLAAG